MDFRKFVRLLDSGSISEILLTDHVKLRLKQRNVDPKLVEELLLKRQKALRGVEHQGGNRFKLTYVHPESRGMDLVIVVEARERKSKMRLTVITAFPQPASRRIRVSEDGEKC
ncbi:hypothetical protein [Thermococcus nautili]|uniref:DUF4258 domain-containing protein n=1 Tax=Thermococcus nautili TaxID=195522 RepID=W8NSV3_9EURY|nr:hypothetical protein [Thermococcus nautili]AHL22308.1 hypothetical protein BD01_0685 [Thermococcus nautili]